MCLANVLRQVVLVENEIRNEAAGLHHPTLSEWPHLCHFSVKRNVERSVVCEIEGAASRVGGGAARGGSVGWRGRRGP